MQRKFRTLIVAVFAAACGEVKVAPQGAEARPACPQFVFDSSYYFPAGSFPETYPGADEFNRKWYSQHLAAMREPSLSCGAMPAEETYRFLWLRNFDHPVAVRIFRTNKKYQLHAIELDGTGGYAPGRPLRRVQRELSRDDWTHAVAKLGAADFWKARNGRDKRIVLDGSEWVFEGRKNLWRVIAKTSPTGDRIAEAGREFLRLSGFGYADDSIY